MLFHCCSKWKTILELSIKPVVMILVISSFCFQAIIICYTELEFHIQWNMLQKKKVIKDISSIFHFRLSDISNQFIFAFYAWVFLNNNLKTLTFIHTNSDITTQNLCIQSWNICKKLPKIEICYDLKFAWTHRIWDDTYFSLKCNSNSACINYKYGYKYGHLKFSHMLLSLIICLILFLLNVTQNCQGQCKMNVSFVPKKYKIRGKKHTRFYTEDHCCYGTFIRRMLCLWIYGELRSV